MSSIAAYCAIRNNEFRANGKLILKDEQASPDGFAERLYRHLNVSYPRFFKMDRMCKLGFISAEVLLAGERDIEPEKAALVLSNSHASLDTDVRYEESTASIPSPALFVYTLPNIVTGEISIRHKLKGENAFFVTARFDFNLIADYVEMVFAAGASVCLAGWIDLMAGDTDVFLYLAKNSEGPIDHSAHRIQALYEAWKS